MPTKAFLYSDASIGKEENTFVGPSYVKTGGIFFQADTPISFEKGRRYPFSDQFWRRARVSSLFFFELEAGGGNAIS